MVATSSELFLKRGIEFEFWMTSQPATRVISSQSIRRSSPEVYATPRFYTEHLVASIFAFTCLAAISSVPRSVDNPIASSEANVEGSLRVFLAARDAGVRRVVMASSSSVYGKSADVPTVEDAAVAPISPYAVSKASAEMYASVCSKLYELDVVCLRYFNVFGPWQDPASDYAAVIPRFISAILEGAPIEIHGDGGQSRDFSYIENVVQANLLAASAEGDVAGEYNIALGRRTSVQELFELLCDIMGVEVTPAYTETRAGDIRTSMADISKARSTFGYDPTVNLRSGLEKTVAWLSSPR